MANQAAFTLIDNSTGTPVNHVFTPIGVKSDGLAEWRNIGGGIIAGYEQFSIRVRPPIPKSPNPAYKVTLRMEIPILKTAATAQSTGFMPDPAVARSGIAEASFLVSSASELAERKTLEELFMECILVPNVQDAIRNMINAS